MLVAYPDITTQELSSACRALERRCHDRLDGTTWRSVRWTGQELQIKQTRLHINEAVSDNHDEMEPLEDSDEVDGMVSSPNLDDGEFVRQIPSTTTRSIDIAFSITFSPTYSVPVLWFDAPDFKSSDQLYRTLVPQHLHDAIADVGVLGGISQAYHPLTGLPSYFVHPCNTHQALQAVNNGQTLTAEEYLLLWLGLVGSAVGLHVPSRLISDVA